MSTMTTNKSKIPQPIIIFDTHNISDEHPQERGDPAPPKILRIFDLIHSSPNPQTQLQVDSSSPPISLGNFLQLCFDPKVDKEKSVFPLIEKSVIGEGAVFDSPFGPRQVVYCDYFASGKSLSFIEDYIRDEVLPFYANTHTESTETGSRTNEMREEARNIIKESINGMASLGEDKEACVIFTGSGSTAAINKLVHIFKLKDPDYWNQFVPTGLADIIPSPKKENTRRNLWNFKAIFKSSNKSKEFNTKADVVPSNLLIEDLKRPVVFISIQEHHANILPWRTGTVADIIVIPNENETISLYQLEKELQKYEKRPLKIGSFSAGSNITGTLNDTLALSILLHRYGAFAVFDYAGVGSYIPVNMNPSIIGKYSDLAYKDAVFLSPHKMIGGPSTPGVLVISKSTLSKLTNDSYHPSQVGGGIVQFVDKNHQVFINDLEAREETGTPAIIESIRCGIVFLVKQAIGSEDIYLKELQHLKYMKARLSPHKSILVLGDLTKPRVPVLSFLITDQERMTLKKPWIYHYNFIAAALNDIFGIQSRGGCMCAGPYAKELLNVSDEQMAAFEDIVVQKYCPAGSLQDVSSVTLNSFKPGFTRLSFNYFATKETIDFVLDALVWLSENALELLGLYDFEPESGNWFAKNKSSKSGQLLLASSGARVGGSSCSINSLFAVKRAGSVNSINVPSKSECFELAEGILKMDRVPGVSHDLEDHLLRDGKLRRLRWFIIQEDLTEEDNLLCTHL